MKKEITKKEITMSIFNLIKIVFLYSLSFFTIVVSQVAYSENHLLISLYFLIVSLTFLFNGFKLDNLLTFLSGENKK